MKKGIAFQIKMSSNLASFTDVLGEDEIADSQGSQPISLPSSSESQRQTERGKHMTVVEVTRPVRGAGQRGEFRSVEEIDPKYRDVFTYPYFNLIQSRVLDDALYSDKSMVVCAPTGSGKTVVFEMAIVQLLMELENKNFNEDFKIIYMAPVKALCTERLTEWYSKFTKLGLMCIEVTGDTDVDFSQLKPYRIIITTPEKWDMLTRRWRDHKGLVETIKLFLIDEVHILNDELRGPVLEAVVSRMKTIESSAQSVHRIEQLQKQYQERAEASVTAKDAPRIRFVAVSATINNPEDVAAWLGSREKPAVYYKFDDECRPVKLKRVVEGYPCPEGTSIFKFDIILNYKLWPIIQKYHDGKPTLIFCNTRKSVSLTAEALSRELTISFTPEQQARLNALASTIKNKKLQALVLSGVGCHHAGLLYEERINIETAFRNRDLPILITTTTLAMGVNLPAHLVIIKNTQQYVNGAYQEYSISTILQMVGRAGRPQFDTEATAVIMTRLADKPRYQALVGGSEPLQSFLHKRLPENLNSEAALRTVTDVAQCVQWLRSTFLYVRAARDPKWYLGLPPNAPSHQISKKIEELCVTAMNGLASSGLITMDEASCIESTEAGRLMSVFYLDLQTMKQITKIEGTETLERLLWIICESHELSDMHLRVDERRCLNALNRNTAATTIRFPMKGKIATRQMKLNCIIQAILGCLHIPDPSLNQEAMKIMRIAERVCKCLVAYLTRPDLVSNQPKYYTAVLNSIILAKCVSARLWENSPYVSKQLKGIGPTFSTLLATAGKTNFMLLEESHPRDLERIMNKGAPAGNVIRKQVSLLPKYQLIMTPIDEKKVYIQLSLLNKEQLAENIDNLTAGDRHKSYIVVGDSENHLLLLTSFQDRDFISTYDGTITHEITRIHNFEHKILIHCVSSNFVGLDVHEKYTFKNIEPMYSHGVASSTNIMEEPTKEKPALKQTSLTDVYKMRKRKCNENDVTQSKEKKKRENALIDKFRNLKESFGYKSKKLMQDLHNTTEASNKILTEITTSTGPFTNDNRINVQSPSSTSQLYIEHNKNVSNHMTDPNYPEMNIEHIDDDDFLADECVDSILKEIENEISKNHDDIDSAHNKTLTTFSAPSPYSIGNKSLKTHSCFLTNSTNSIEQKSSNLAQTSGHYITKPSLKAPEKSIKRRKNTKSNFAFIDNLEKTREPHEEEVSRDNGFSETIKNHIEKFLQNTKLKSNQTDTGLENLLEDTDKSISQAPRYCDINLNKLSTYMINESEQTQGCVKNETENSNKDLLYNTDDNKNRELHLSDSSTQSYDLKDLPDCSIPNINTKNGIETHNTTIKSDLNSADQRLALPEMESARNNNECVFMNNVSTIAKNLSNLSKIRQTNIDDTIRDHFRSDSNVIDLTDHNAIGQALYVSNRISNGDNNIINDFSIENSTADINVKNSINDNIIGEITQKMYISETESENPDMNLVEKVIVSDKNHGYKYNSKDNLKKGYINRYSFSATKIDISSKKSEDLEIQYIRKLKLDLNVMEIVSKRKTNCKINNVMDIQSNHNDLTTISSNVNLNTEEKPLTYPCYECKILEIATIPKKQTNFDRWDLSHNTCSGVILCNQNDSKIQRPLVRKCDDRPSSCSDKQLINKLTPKDAEKTQSSQAIHCNNTFCNDANLKPNSKEEVDDEEEYNIRCKDINTEKLIKNNSKMENILNRYSKILKKSDTYINTNVTHMQILQESSSKKPAKAPSKRLFKITDIHKLDTPLPKSLIIDVSRSPRPSDRDVLTRIKEVQIVNSQPSTKIPQRNKYTSQDNDNVMADVPYKSIQNEPLIKETEQVENDVVPSVQYNGDFTNEDGIRNYEEIYHCPVSLPLETTELDFVEQSMFDPKTLLKSFSKDRHDEIIPPPPEFCDDDISYSPTRTEDDVLKYDLMNVALQEGNYNALKELNDSHSLLTPSKEIETWTLSREDKWDSREFQPQPTRSFTVTHVNSPGDNVCFSGEHSRQAKLCNFKFAQKSKMRI